MRDVVTPPTIRFNAAPLFFGTILGKALSRAYRPVVFQYPHQHPYRFAVGAYYSAHVQWCLAHHPSYNPAIDRYAEPPRQMFRCVSPYGNND